MICSSVLLQEFGNYIVNLMVSGEQWFLAEEEKRKSKSFSRLAAQHAADSFTLCSVRGHKEANPELINYLKPILEPSGAPGLPNNELMLTAEVRHLAA